MNLQDVRGTGVAQLEPLVQAYPFKAYRNYRVLSRAKQTSVMLAEIAATASRRNGVVLRASSGSDQALSVARVLDWDSAFFGVPMGRIEYLFSSRPTLLPSLLQATLDALKQRGVRHVSARADVADVELVAKLEAAGFRLMDALVTYTTRPHMEPPNAVREAGTIRDFADDDAAELLQIATDAYRGFRGRFHLDPHIPDDRCDEFYVEWTRQCLARTMADTILVSEGSEGQILGFLAFRRREPVSSACGVPVFGGGLGACRPDTPGAYAGLIRAGTLWAHERDGVAECQTQNYNFPTIRIYEAVGAHYVRAEYTLHLYL